MVTCYPVAVKKKRKGEMPMRALAAYLRPYRKESILAPLFKLLEALFDLLVPLVVARMIDAGSGERTVFLCRVPAPGPL